MCVLWKKEIRENASQIIALFTKIFTEFLKELYLNRKSSFITHWNFVYVRRVCTPKPRTLVANSSAKNLPDLSCGFSFVVLYFYLWSRPREECCFRTKIDRIFWRFETVARAGKQMSVPPLLQLKAFPPSLPRKGRYRPRAVICQIVFCYKYVPLKDFWPSQILLLSHFPTATHWGKKPQFIQKFTIWKSHFSQNSHFENLIFHKIHNFKVSLFDKIHIFQSVIFHKIHFFGPLILTKFTIFKRLKRIKF